MAANHSPHLTGLIFTDPTILTDNTTDPAALAAQFDKLVAGLFLGLTPAQRKQVADLYPIALSPAVGNSFDRTRLVGQTVQSV